MANFTSPMARRIFVQAQPTLTSILNTSGIWSASGAQFIQVEQNALSLTPNEPKVPLNFVHGTPSPLGSIQGRKSGAWSLTIPIMPNGTPATAPDTDLLFQSIFGGAGALVTGTAIGNAWLYGFVDFSVVPLTILSFNHGQPTTASMYALGCVTERATITVNSNILSMALSGSAVAMADVDTFSVLDADAQGGLSAFPTEPVSFASNGHAIHGYGGQLTATISGTPYILSKMCNNFTAEITTGIGLNDDFVDTLYPGAALYGPRAVTASIGCLNSDSSVLTQLKVAARLNQPVNLQYDMLSNPSGQRLQIKVNGVQLIPASLRENANSMQCDFGQSLASVSPGASNDATIGFA